MSKRCSLNIIVKDVELAEPLKKSLGPNLTLNIYQNNNSENSSFSKTINNVIINANTEYIIIFSHRVRPTESDVYRLLKKIDEGFGLVMFYKLACFGFKTSLIDKIGFFDERFIPAGYEDDDFYIRLKESNIGIYEDSSIEYHAGPSTWTQELFEAPYSKFKQPITYFTFLNKWQISDKGLKRNLPELVYDYKLKYIDKNCYFKPWSESYIKSKHVSRYCHIKINTDIIQNKTILIFGGTGSLGQKFIDIYNNNNNKIYVYSRDENKHWMMQISNKFKDIQFVIGDIRDSLRVQNTIQSINPSIIIIASAMKHIDRCEYDVSEALMTNTQGVTNVCNSVKSLETQLNNLESVIFVSTDKATSPCNVYGMTKSLSERIMVEYSKKMNSSKFKFVNCRYGNVLNSRGSIIPKLQESTEDILYLTHNNMTRFIMTQEEAVKLIEYAIINGKSGDTIIPKLKSMKIRDLFEIFSEMKTPNKEIKITKIRAGEKLHEELLNTEEIRRTSEKNNYYIMHSTYDTQDIVPIIIDTYTSNENIMSKDSLYDYLTELKLI